MRAAPIVAVALWACEPAAVRPHHSLEPTTQLPPPVETATPPLLTLAHRPALGAWTLVEVRKADGTYVLKSRRLFCRGSEERAVGTAAAAQLERAMEDLNPAILPESDPCPKQGRDGALWITAHSITSEPRRARSFRPAGAEACTTFHDSATTLMALAGLECTEAGCFRASELPTKEVHCP